MQRRNGMKKILIYAAACAALLFLLFIWISVDAGRLPSFITALYAFPHGDKVGHFLLMGLVAFFLGLAFCSGRKEGRKKRLCIAGIAFIVLTTIEEMSQTYFANRSMDAVDLLCSYAGIFMGTLLAWSFCSK